MALPISVSESIHSCLSSFWVWWQWVYSPLFSAARESFWLGCDLKTDSFFEQKLRGYYISCKNDWICFFFSDAVDGVLLLSQSKPTMMGFTFSPPWASDSPSLRNQILVLWLLILSSLRESGIHGDNGRFILKIDNIHFSLNNTTGKKVVLGTIWILITNYDGQLQNRIGREEATPVNIFLSI